MSIEDSMHQIVQILQDMKQTFCDRYNSNNPLNTMENMKSDLSNINYSLQGINTTMNNYMNPQLSEGLANTLMNTYKNKSEVVKRALEGDKVARVILSYISEEQLPTEKDKNA